ncbi:GlcG/HbpS family heme-binding protein [Caenimonas aquaedulcis]|uniref:Heme-binding protein n=1 Tax=Caenimonas aquaedulcis TaxID=2793270 RepID=A0A931H2M2_9BURK|nr:heme-binding protein [Caenimonas aquaedulcis]MBG9387418.1 heme-binding protein [Caenimonas aquaedulcis]
MKLRASMCAALVALAGSAAAQQATYTVRNLTPEAALRAAQAALAACAKSGHQVAVAVTDRAAIPLVMLRDRHAGTHTPETATNKAFSALSFKIDTLALARATQPGEASAGIRNLPRVVAVGGGRLIESAGSLVGAIGVSGAPGGEADDACAKAGIAAIADELEF